MCLKLFWYKVFVPLKIKITQIPNGFRHNFLKKSVDSVRKKCRCAHERASILSGLNGRVFHSNKESCPY